MKPLKKLLVIRLSALGDICMTLPVLDSACRAYPDVEFTFVTSKVGAIVYNEVLHYPNLQVRSINKRDYNGLSGLNRLYQELKSFRFDAVADLHDVIRTKYLSLRFRMNATPVRTINKGRCEKKKLIRHSINQQLTNSIERYHEVFTKLGLNFEVDYNPSLYAEKVRNEASNSQVQISQPSVGIAPFAQHQGKVYPEAKMRQVIDLLLEKNPALKIYLFGSRDEQSVLDVWVNAHPDNIVNLAGKQSIDADLQCMARLNLMVSMDSANMHLASLVGLRCLSIWGATHRYAGFLGFGQSDEDCIELPLSCRPCSIYGNKPCQKGEYPCLNGLMPETIATRIIDALKQ